MERTTRRSVTAAGKARTRKKRNGFISSLLLFPLQWPQGRCGEKIK